MPRLKAKPPLVGSVWQCVEKCPDMYRDIVLADTLLTVEAVLWKTAHNCLIKCRAATRHQPFTFLLPGLFSERFMLMEEQHAPAQ